MPDRVADASIIAAFTFQEPEADEALSLVRGADLYVPVLLQYELASIARKKIRLYPNQSEGYLRSLTNALAMAFHWVDVDHVSVVRLSWQTGLSTYDASYLYVARTLGVPLVTFDNRLRQASQTLS